MDVERRAGLFDDDERHVREAVMLRPGERTRAQTPAGSYRRFALDAVVAAAALRALAPDEEEAC